MSEPIIKAREVEQFRRFLNLHPNCLADERERLMGALAAFLKGRVPDAMPVPVPSGRMNAQRAIGFHACRDIVLRGGK